MLDLPYESYAWLKAAHVVAVVGWVGGLVVLTEMLAFSAEAPDDPAWPSRQGRLMSRWINPAGALVLISGVLLVFSYGDLDERWLHAKFALVWLLLLYHGRLLLWMHRSAGGSPSLTGKAFRRLKMFPIVLFIGIVVLVVVRPF